MDKKELIDLIEDRGCLEIGDFHKHSACHATITYIVTEREVEEEPELKPYLGKQLVLDGLQDYNYGFENYGDITILKQVLEEVPEKIIPAHTLVKWVEEGTI